MSTDTIDQMVADDRATAAGADEHQREETARMRAEADEARAAGKSLLDEPDEEDQDDQLSQRDQGDKAPEKRSAEDKKTAAEDGKQAAGDEGGDFNPGLLRRAAEQGMSEAEARGFGSPAALERALVHSDKLLLGRFRESQRQQRQPDQQQGDDRTDDRRQPPQRQVEDRSQQQQQQAPNWEEVFAAAEQELGPEGAKPLRALYDHFAPQMQRLDRMESYLQERAEQDRIAANERESDEFDQEIASREDLAELFGKGTWRDLDRSGTPFKSREAVFLAARDLRAARQAAGLPVGSLKSLLQSALYATFPDFLEKQANAKAQQRVEDRLRDSKGRFTSAPTSTDSSSRYSGGKTAEQKLREWEAKTGKNLNDEG